MNLVDDHNTLPWTAPIFAAVKGIFHAPCAKPTMKAETGRVAESISS